MKQPTRNYLCHIMCGAHTHQKVFVSQSLLSSSTSPRALLLLLVSICRLFVFLTRRDKSHLFSGTSEAAQCASVSVHFTQFWDYDITQCRLESKLNTVLKRSQIVSQTVSFRWWQHKTVFTEVATFGGMGNSRLSSHHSSLSLSLLYLSLLSNK